MNRFVFYRPDAVRCRQGLSSGLPAGSGSRTRCIYSGGNYRKRPDGPPLRPCRLPMNLACMDFPGREGLSRGGTGSAFRASQSAGTRNFETMSACGTCIGRPRIEPHCRPQDQRSMVVLPCRRIASDSVRLSPVSEFFPQQTWKFTDYLYMAIRFGILHDIRT